MQKRGRSEFGQKEARLAKEKASELSSMGEKFTEIWQKPKQQGPINYSASMQSDEIVSR
jgi:hypothetical protein